MHCRRTSHLETDISALRVNTVRCNKHSVFQLGISKEAISIDSIQH